VWMQRYIMFYKRCVTMIENDAELTDWIHKDSYYVNDNMTPQMLMEIFDKPYYTLHPFVFERLSGYFLSMSGAKIHQGGWWGTYVMQT
jgi:hypothetical protein